MIPMSYNMISDVVTFIASITKQTIRWKQRIVGPFSDFSFIVAQKSH